jgi:phosphoribosyl 1,2-cyclic phosphate phosphodiesterase
MKLTFLGTGTSQGIPVIGCDCATCRSTDPRDKRLRTAAHLEAEGKRFVFDCGPDFRQQMLNKGFDHVDAILMTHEHNDHIIGLDDVRPLNFRQKIDMPIYGLKRTLDELEKRFAYAFEDRPYPGAPRFQLIPIKALESFQLQGVEILPLNILHGDLPILGYRIGGLCYITDAKSIPEKSFSRIQNCQVLVVNALRHRHHNTHFNLEEALAFIDKVQPQKAFLTHLSHLFPPYEKLETELPKNVHLAYDGLCVDVD